MIIVWHHRDLRLEDNTALTHAAKSGLKLLPLYIHDPKAHGNWAPGKAALWWLQESLKSLSKEYKKKGSALALREGNSLKILKEIPGVTEVCWIERSEPLLKMRDLKVQTALEKQGITVTILPGNYLIDPNDVLNKSGKPYLIFAPFYKNVRASKPIAAPKLPPRPNVPIGKLSLKTTLSFDEHWTPGRKGALAALKNFNGNQYGKLRDFPAADATSRLSPHLAFGEISVREVWQAISSPSFRSELGWREFSNYFLHHFPDSTDTSWRKEFNRFPWKKNAAHFKRWKEGTTGYPIVDAGMRQLKETGWMHNRVRMITASFLVKDLMIDWREGAKYFWEHLVDADLANNTMGWQWTAGSGPDASPFFRIFNPDLQAKKFDPDEEYIQRYVLDLERDPMIDHKKARKCALNAIKNI